MPKNNQHHVQPHEGGGWEVKRSGAEQASRVLPTKDQPAKVCREISKQYQEQLEFRLASATAYDSGKPVEAKRLAIVLRILLYSKGQSKGLLQQLGKLNVSFWDTAFPYNPEVSPHYTGLIWTNARGDYRPLFDPTTHPTTSIPFEKWWQTKPIIVAVSHERFTRKDRARQLAD